MSVPLPFGSPLISVGGLHFYDESVDMTNLICAIAGAIAAYGAVQYQLENPAGRCLLIAGVAIVILTLVNDEVPDEPVE